MTNSVKQKHYWTKLLPAIIGGFTVAANIIFESPLMGFMNTPDYIDAIFGIVGTMLAFLFLVLTYKYGFVEILSDKTCRRHHD